MTAENINRSQREFLLSKQAADKLEELQREFGGTRSGVFTDALNMLRSGNLLKMEDLSSGEMGIESSRDVISWRSSSDHSPHSELIARENNDIKTNRSTHRFPNSELETNAPGLYLDKFHAQAFKNLDLSTASLIIPINKEKSGILIESIPLIWNDMIDCLEKDWSRIYELPPVKFEELIASTFHRAGYDEVILTPRSGDHGRDVIAIKRGVGCIKIIGSVKRYAEKNRVTHDDVRALLGVLSAEQDASKALLVTTSDFQPKVYTDRYIKSFLPTRLELMNWQKLKAWLLELRVKGNVIS